MLVCEFRENPTGIDVVKPRLSWQLKSDKLAGNENAQCSLADDQIKRSEYKYWFAK